MKYLPQRLRYAINFTVSHFKKNAAHADSKVMYAHFHTELAELTVV